MRTWSRREPRPRGPSPAGRSGTGRTCGRQPWSGRNDGSGNYNFGVTEQLIFPEIDYDKVDNVRGMNITIVTTARTNAEGKALLDAFNFPFRRPGERT